MSSTPLAYINQLDIAQVPETKPQHYQTQLSWMFEPASIVIASGELKFDDASIPTVDLVAGDRSVIIGNLQNNIDYDGTLTLKLNNGQTLTQEVSWVNFKGLNRITWKFNINSTGQLSGKLFWGMPEELSAQVLSFQLSSMQIDDNNPFSVAANKNGIALSSLKPSTKHTIDWMAKLRSGNKLDCMLMATTPVVVIAPPQPGPRSLGHQHTMQNGQVNQVWNIPQTTYHLPLGQDQVTHQDNAMTFAQTPHIAPNSLVSAAGNDYVQSFSRDQVNDLPSYDQAIQNAPKQALSTTTQKTLTHVGDSQVTHAGTTVINTHVLHKQHKIDSPYISNQHQGKRIEVLNGQTYTRNHINYSRNSNQEVAQHGMLTQQYGSSMTDVQEVTQTIGTQQLQAGTQVLSAQTKVVTRNTTINANSVNFGTSPTKKWDRIAGCPQIFLAYLTPDYWYFGKKPQSTQGFVDIGYLFCDYIRSPSVEMVELGNRKLPYPTSQADAKTSDCSVVAEAQYPTRAGDKLLTVKTLFPPVIVNLRTDAYKPDPKDSKKLIPKEPNARQTLSDKEIAYFTAMGQNATIMIHGFGVTYGAFANQIADITPQQTVVNINTPNPKMALTVSVRRTDYPSTICTTFDQLKKRYPVLDKANLVLPASLDPQDDSCLNGTDAHAWLVHIEDNLNRASNQFDGSDYSKYQRVITVTWSGDVFLPNYIDSEEVADAAGIQLAPLLKQLIDAGIKINIIAHSMGNRVLLKALETLAALGGNYRQNSIDHIFMWDAAVPDTALSNDPTKDLSAKRNCYFKDAILPPKKITVLYSQNDEVLKHLYTWANDEYQDTDQVGRVVWNDVAPEFAQPIPEDKVVPALGWSGPDDSTIAELGKKLIQADLTKWTKGYSFLESHSYMQIPNAVIMEHAYKTWIINQNYGMQSFGVYNRALFDKGMS